MTPVALDRLRDGRDISAVLRGRRQRAGRLVVVHARARQDGAAPRIAVVASRRTGNAVERNRAKRLLREASRHLDWTTGADIVLVARAACSRNGFASVHDELSRLAAELDLLAATDASVGEDAGRGAAVVEAGA